MTACWPTMRGLRLGAIATLVLAAGAAEPAAGQVRDPLRLATGPHSGTYHVLGKEIEALTQATGPAAALLPVAAVETSGSVSNIHMLLRGEAQVAIVQADVLYAAVTGRPPFPERIPSLRALATLFGEVVHVVARPGVGIDTLSDLKGRKVGVGAVGSGSTGLAVDILHAHGIGARDFERQLASPEETMARFRAGQIDAFFLVAAAPSPIVAEALTAGGRLIPIARIKAASIANKAPFFVRDEIAAGTYPGQSEAVDVVRVDAMLAALADLRPELCYELLQKIYATAGEGGTEGGNLARLQRLVPSLRSPTDVRADDLNAVPLHSGAMAYYGERDVFQRPVVVEVGIYANDIFNLDIASGSFDIDFYVWFRYRGRLEANPNDFRFEFMNGEIRHRDPPVVEKFGGFTSISYKVVGRFRTSFPLRNFPFDAQVLPVVIEHPEFEAAELVWSPDDTIDGKPRDALATLIEPGIRVDEWRVTAVRHGVSDHEYASDMGSTLAGSGRKKQRYSQYRFEVELRRQLISYLAKFCAPLAIIVLMAFLVFFIPAAEFQVQVVVTVASLLACGAFHIAQAGNMPRVPYMVTADLFFVIAYVAIFLTLLQVIAEHGLVYRGQVELAARLDRWARVLFPLAFFGSTGLVIAWGLQ